MKKRHFTMHYCRVLSSLLLLSLSFYVYSTQDNGLIFDDEGGFIEFRVDNTITLSSYSLESSDGSFAHTVKLNASYLNSKDADLTNGIKGTIGTDGHIILKVVAYDNDYAEHLIYQIELTDDSAEVFSGASSNVSLDVYKAGSETGKQIEVQSTDIRALLRSVVNSYEIDVTKYEQHDRYLRALARYYASDDSSDPRLAGQLPGGDGGTHPLLKESGTSSGRTASLFRTALMSVAPAAGQSVYSSDGLDNDIVISHRNNPVRQFGNIHEGEDISINPGDKLYPAGSYPVKVYLEMRNATFYGAKVPGISELAPVMFEAYHTLTPERFEREVATKAVWQDSPGVLDEGDIEVLAPAAAVSSCSSCFDAVDLTDSPYGRVRLIRNPGTSSSAVFDYTPDGAVNGINRMFMGHHILLQVAAPKNRIVFSKTNPDHYPKLEGFPHAWMAFFSGEALYQCEPSIQPGEWRPWLGYDSQVHGTAIRRYPEGFAPKFVNWHVDTSIEGFVVYTWTAKITRRMDTDVAEYSPVHTWPKQKTSPVRQRNNQREGLNMQLLRAWSDNTAPTWLGPDFETYEGPSFVSGLDPDEFLYLRNSASEVTDIIRWDSEPWKTVPDDEAANPLNDIVTAYKKNRINHVDNKDYRDLYGNDYGSHSYEIQDLGTSAESPNGIAAGNNAAPGHMKVHLPFTTDGVAISLPMSVRAPLKNDPGFYGSITGTTHPSVWERGVPYLVDGLFRDPSYNERYAVQFVYEDSLGRRKYHNIFSKDEPPEVHAAMTREGSWQIELPRMQGYGYYTISLWYKNTRYSDSWTRIGGKELLDISLRFVSVPTGLSGFTSAVDYQGVALKEYPGDGAQIYLEDYRDSKTWRFDSSKFGRFGRSQTRTYVLERDDIITFEAMDADPHTFVHPGTEWYLSSRTQAKRVTRRQLRDRIVYDFAEIADDGSTSNSFSLKNQRVNFSPRQAVNFQVKVAYNGASSVTHRLEVVDPSHRQNNRKASIETSVLSGTKRRWLEADGVHFNSNHVLVMSVIKLDSKYRYIDGPRMHTGNQVNRFNPANDYADGYVWKVGPLNTTPTDYDMSDASIVPSGLEQALTQFNDGNGWFPQDYVRHTSEKNNDGVPLPDDIQTRTISVINDSVSLTDAQEGRILEGKNGRPEAWQIRYPWISYLWNPNSYYPNPTGVLHFRTRTNIKVLYSMSDFFDNNIGAFSGNPPDIINGDDSYEHLKELGIYLHLMDDETKDKREFYRDLSTGRSIIFYSGTVGEAQVSNARAAGTVIATNN